MTSAWEEWVRNTKAERNIRQCEARRWPWVELHLLSDVQKKKKEEVVKEDRWTLIKQREIERSSWWIVQLYAADPGLGWARSVWHSFIIERQMSGTWANYTHLKGKSVCMMSCALGLARDNLTWKIFFFYLNRKTVHSSHNLQSAQLKVLKIGLGDCGCFWECYIALNQLNLLERVI